MKDKAACISTETRPAVCQRRPCMRGEHRQHTKQMISGEYELLCLFERYTRVCYSTGVNEAYGSDLETQG